MCHNIGYTAHYMLQILYTDTDQIRSTLGVSHKDMSDERLTVRLLEKELLLDLISWVSNHATLEDAVNMGTATEVELQLVDSIQLYSTYFCARLVIPSLQMATLQSVSDGKNSSERFSNVDWDKLYERLSERMAFYKKFIIDNNSGLTSTSPFTFKPFSIASSAYNPVTGV